MRLATRSSIPRHLLLTAGLLFAAHTLLPLSLAHGQAELPKPAALTVEGTPAVPISLAERLNEFQNMRSAAFCGWSPKGRGILIQTRFAQTAQLHRVYEPGGRREQITFYNEPCGGRFLPAAADDALLVSLGQDGDENYQNRLHGAKNFQRVLLTDGRSRNTLGPVKRDGSKMIIHSNLRNGRDTDLFLVDCRQPRSREVLLETKNEYWSARDWSHDGNRLILARYVSANESHPALFDIASRQVRMFPIPGKGPAAFGAIAFARDDAAAWLATDARGEFRELARLDLNTFEYSWHSADLKWDVDELEVCPATGQVAFTINEDGASRLFLLEQEKRRELPLPACVASGLEFSPDGKQLGLTLSRGDRPSDVYSIDLANNKLSQWTFSETGGLDPDSFVPPQIVHFPSFDGREIPALLYLPPLATKSGRTPVLISIHGGPESQSRPLFNAYTQFLLNRLGVAVIFPNVRGSTGYGKTYTRLDNGPLRENAVKDIGALLDWIAKQPQFDAKRVAVSGASYGGYLTLASLAAYPERFRAGIDVVGIANFITFLESTSAYRRDLRRVEYGDERDPAMRAVFEHINPVANAHRIRAALMVVHGKNDPRVPFAEAQQIAEKVRKHGPAVWTLFADNEGHGFEKKENRDYSQAMETMFLERWLLDR